MALVMTGEERIAAPIETVWAALNDPETLRQCIPNCQKMERLPDGRMTATATFKVGPVKATFSGDVTLENLDPPHGCTLRGEGRGGIAGFAKGSADVRLASDGPSATVLSYAARADVGGKIAQMGSRLLDSTARKVAAFFFSNLAAKLAGGELVAETEPAD